MKTGHNLLQKLIDQFSLAFVFGNRFCCFLLGTSRQLNFISIPVSLVFFLGRKVYSDLISFVKVRRRTFFARINFDKKRMWNDRYWEGEVRKNIMG